MAKQKDQKAKPQAATSANTGGTKSQRRSARTIANKARSAASREIRLTRAEERRDDAISQVENNGADFRKARGKNRVAMIGRADRCRAQRERVERKREQRKNFSKLSHKERREHREAGLRGASDPRRIHKWADYMEWYNVTILRYGNVVARLMGLRQLANLWRKAENTPASFHHQRFKMEHPQG